MQFVIELFPFMKDVFGIMLPEDAFEKMQRNFERGKEGRGGLLNRDYYRLRDNIVFGETQIGEARTSGGILLSPFVGIKLPQDLDYKAVLIKIARGLHYHHTKEIIPNNYTTRAEFIFSDFERHNRYIKQLNISGQMGDFFRYKGIWVKNGPKKGGIWYMCFYRSIVGMAGFSQPSVSA